VLVYTRPANEGSSINLQFVIDALKFRGYRRACLRPTCFFFFERVGCYAPKHFRRHICQPLVSNSYIQLGKGRILEFRGGLDWELILVAEG
jgi:hypothetical protein